MASQDGDSSELLDQLYPVPLSTGIAALPGPTSASSRALLSILRHNRENYHVFFNDKGFHNHAAHHMLAIYGLGASPEIIEEAYNKTYDYLKPAFKSPEPITDENFTVHLGDDQYYDSYLSYFSEYLRDHSPNEAFERFILSSSYNFEPQLAAKDVKDVKNANKEGKKHPEMLNRLLAGLVHPFIHLGYGFEFGLPGQVAEGLAWTAVHKEEQTELVPPSFFAKLSEPGILAGLTSRLSISRVLPSALEEKRPNFAFLRRIRDHAKFTPTSLGRSSDEDHYTAVVTKVGDTLTALVSEWADEWLEGVRGDADIEKRLEGMVEEVVWGNVIWFGVGGWHARGSARTFNSDFFVVHLVTSAIFLLAFVLPSEHAPYPPVPLASRLTLLKAYLATSAAWYIARGNAALPIKDFYSSTSDRLTAPPATPAPPPASRKPLGAPGGPWERIVVNAVAHPDEHVCKAVRSFATFATCWGGRPAGYYAGGGGEAGLEGREALDGTLFVRVVSLTLDRLGWAHESGRELGRWDRDGYPEWSSDDPNVVSAYL